MLDCPDLIDVGVNLTDKSFASDREAVLEAAADVGVRRMILTGTTERGSAEAAELAASRPGALWSTAGVHPHYVKDCGPDTLPALRALCGLDQVRAVGECGLDFFRDLSPRPTQEQWLETQLGLAEELGMPVFLHERDASERFTAILRAWRNRLPAAVVHCFTGSEEALRGYLDLDLHIGITGWICDERRGLHLRDLVPSIPLDRLMLETDAPYLKPRNIRPRAKTRRNEPKWLPYVLEAVAEVRGESAADIAAATTATAERFFGLPRRS